MKGEMVLGLVLMAAIAAPPSGISSPTGAGVREGPAPAVAMPGSRATDSATARAADAAGAAASLVSRSVDLARERPLPFFGAFVLGVILLVPGSLLTLAAGAAYGVWIGLAVSLAASLCAAAVHFVLVRRFLRERVRTWCVSQDRLRVIDEGVAREGGKVVALTRASSLVPGALMSALCAVSAIPFRVFLPASAIGFALPTLLWAAAGATTAAVGQGSGLPGPSAPLWIVSIIALGLALRYVARAVRREVRLAETSG